MDIRPSDVAALATPDRMFQALLGVADGHDALCALAVPRRTCRQGTETPAHLSSSVLAKWAWSKMIVAGWEAFVPLLRLW